MAKHILRLVAFLMVATLLVPLAVAFAYTWHIDFTITESAGNSYTSLPLSGLANNSYLAANGYISSTGLNTRVYASDNSVLPHMLTEDKTWFVTPQPALNTQIVTYALGDTAVTAFDIIPGYGGYVTTPDDATLELGRVFDISIPGYWKDGTIGQDKTDAWQVEMTGTTLTAHALNAGGSDNWTMSAVTTEGYHTVRVRADGLTAYLYVDGNPEDTYNLYATSSSTTYNSSAITYAKTNRPFYYAGRPWVVWYQTYEPYFTSFNGTGWETPTHIQPSTFPAENGFGITSWFDGTYFQYANRDDSSSNYIRYRKGEPQSDGTMSWLAAEQAVNLGFDHTGIGIVTTSDNLTFVAYAKSSNSNLGVISNVMTDGTWVTGTNQSIGTATSIAAYILTYSGTKVYVLRSDAGALKGRNYTGVAWSGEDETVFASDGNAVTEISANTDLDGNIYAVWRRSNKIECAIRDTSGSWSSVTTLVDTDATATRPVISYDSVADIMYVWWIDKGDGVYFRARYPNGTWSTTAEMLDANVDASGSVSASWVDTYSNGGIQLLFRAASTNGVHAWLTIPWSFPDNANDWTWFQDMPYADNVTMSVQGIPRLEYNPDSIISGTTLPDESGNGNDGTFSWGTNPADVDVIPGPLTSDVDNSEPEEGASPWELVPTVPSQPAGLFTDGGEGMLGLAELADASEATGNPREMFPLMLAFLLALLLGFAVYGATHNARMGVKGSILLQSITSLVVMIFFYVGGGGVIPGWVLIPFSLEAFFIMLWRNPQHSAT